VVGVVLVGCGQSDDTIGERAALPPLVVGKDAPLLLDEPTEAEKVLTEAESKNATCYVCHANYQDESFAQSHAKANIGCVNCHGQSIAHKNDENHITPPDKMYPASEIDKSCQKCHTSHDVQPAEVVRRWQQRTGDKKTEVLCKKCHEDHDIPAAAVVRKWQKQSGQKIYEKPIVCTDCHGKHRLKMRSVRWDKKTGKLLRGR
jgi:formate-dependent nitrite reductase cytochrome c552 subunit